MKEKDLQQVAALMDSAIAKMELILLHLSK